MGALGIKMKIVHKKTWMPLFEDIASGRKTFDIRLGNSEIAVNDTIVFEEFDQTISKYTGRRVAKTVIYKIKLTVNSLVKFGEEELEFWTEDQIKKYGLFTFSLGLVKIDLKEINITCPRCGENWDYDEDED